MQEQLKSIREMALAKLAEATETAHIDELRVAVLGRKGELTALAEAVAAGADIAADPVLAKHAPWVGELKDRYVFTAENALQILLQETGKVFAAVLEDAGVYKNTCEGRAAFLRFARQVDQAT